MRDSQQRPLPGVTVDLRTEDGRTAASAQTDASGVYRFAALRPGTYSLRAQIANIGDAALDGVVLSEGGAKTVDLTVRPASTQEKKTALQGSEIGEPEFFDQPQFTVAGVTDTTTLGGHGSSADVRNREKLAKDAMALGNDESKSSLPAPALSSESALREAAAHAPTDFEANFSLGKRLAEEGKAQEALPYLARASQLKDDAEIHHVLAQVEEKLGDPVAAVRQYQRAAELSPTETNLFDWGSELLLHRAPAPAVEVFTKGEQLFPQSVRMQLGLGAAQYANGATEEAIRTICMAADKNSADTTAYLFLGKIQVAENTASDELIARLQRFAEQQPENAFANYYYAAGLWKQRRNAPEADDFRDIEVRLKKAVGLDPAMSDAWLLLGILRAEQRDLPGAIGAYQKAIEGDPGSQQAHYRLAQAYQRSGEKEQAEKEIATYEALSKQSAAQEDREHHEIKQFVYTLRQPPQTAQ